LMEDQLKEREDALGKLTRQVTEAAAERERWAYIAKGPP